jgi:hypothetical protein
MLIDSVIIRLNKIGAGIGPDYKLIIHGTGKVVFEGNEKVTNLGINEKTIENNKIVELLTYFKTTDFFSQKEVYEVIDPIGKPYSKISITLPKDSGETVTKSVTFYQGDLSVPNSLKDLEEKIIQTADIGDWIKGKEIGKSKPKTKKSQKTKKKRPIIFATAIIVILIIALLLFSIFFLGFDLLPNISPVDQSNNLKISFITPAFLVDNSGKFYEEQDFKQGEHVYIYLEYENVTLTDEDNCDIKYEIKVKYDGTIIYHNFQNETEFKNYTRFLFNTNDSWAEGNYIVTVDLTDMISDKSTSKETNFTIIAKTFRIVELLTASEIQGIGQYNDSSFFNQGDKVWVYHQYEGFELYDNGSCDLYLQLQVREINGEKNFNTIAHEYDADNIARRWWFTTDETWPKATYVVTGYIKDNISGEADSKNTAFIIQ